MHFHQPEGFTMRLLSRAVLAVSFATTAGAALAATPATGLGQAWPNAQDVSTNAHFHVYVFELGGIHYIQVNDLNGNVLGSVGTAGGQFITLPIGRFAQQVSTPSQPATASTAAAPTASPVTVYNDGATTVTATPLSDGALRLNAARAQSTCDDPIECNIKGVTGASAAKAQSICDDPIECNIKGVNSLNAVKAQSICDDPIECNIKGVNNQ
jgi:hypothetical protein